MTLQVKICGLREPENVTALSALAPDMMGFIFYAPSPRAVTEVGLESTLAIVSEGIKKVAVFVDESMEEVERICKHYGFDYAQLHGQESPEYCRALRVAGISIIKAFPIESDIDLDSLKTYIEHVDLFLFDTPTKQHGGSGTQFDWDLLRHYSQPIPFLLSGGLGPKDIDQIARLNLPSMIGIDANSRLEISPGIKDIGKTKTLIDTLRAL